MFSTIYASQSSPVNAGFLEETMRSSQALYRNLIWNARVRKFFGKVTPLNNISQTEEKIQIKNRAYLGLQAVEITRIVGSESRSNDFDIDFNPLTEKTKDRWVSIATARQNGTGMPPVELIKIEEKYFVRDGHHRISVAKSFGESYIDAVVTEWKVVHRLENQGDRPDQLPLAV